MENMLEESSAPTCRSAGEINQEQWQFVNSMLDELNSWALVLLSVTRVRMSLIFYLMESVWRMVVNWSWDKFWDWFCGRSNTSWYLKTTFRFCLSLGSFSTSSILDGLLQARYLYTLLSDWEILQVQQFWLIGYAVTWQVFLLFVVGGRVLDAFSWTSYIFLGNFHSAVDFSFPTALFVLLAFYLGVGWDLTMVWSTDSKLFLKILCTCKSIR